MSSSAPRAPLTVVLSDESWGISVLQVKEIIEPAALTPLSSGSSFVTGFLIHGGARLPVVDLRRCPGAPAQVAVVQLRPHAEASLPIGLLVDRSAQPAAPAQSGKTTPDALSGFAEVKARVCSLLRLARGFAGEELQALSA